MVVFITAIIFTTATTMIALVTTDYKHRINESKKLQNLYEAESGLDIVRNVITKNADAAIVYANAVVRNYLDTTIDEVYLLDNTYEDIYIEANRTFKLAFFDFLGTQEFDATGLQYSIDAGEFEVSDVNNKTNHPLIYGILNNQYPKLIDGSNAEESERIKKINYTSGPNPYEWTTIDRGIIPNKQAADIKILSYNYQNNVINNIVDNKITIKVKSSFNTINDASGYTNRKTISTKFIVTAPDYSQGIVTRSTPTDTNTYPVQKAIVADGNLMVNSGVTNVYGDIWIKGTDPTGTDYVYDKHDSGIFINESTFNVYETILADGTSTGGNVYTANTFNLGNLGNSKIENKLYALNAYVGPIRRGDNSSNNKLEVTDLVTNNDLTLNSISSSVTAKNYYGINDLTTADTLDNAARESSSIIVNRSEESSINITNAYVMGVAYVDTEDTHFKSGESIGIKGNYIAYKDRLPNSTNDYEFRVYGPLYLVDKMNGTDMTSKQKADYFASYYNDYDNAIRDGGVRITNDIYSIGAYPNAVRNTTDTLTNSGATTGYNTLLDIWSNIIRDTITPKKRDYANEVFYMGAISHEVPDPITSVVTNVEFTDSDYDTAYTGNTVLNTVDNQVDWHNVNSYYPQENITLEPRIIQEARGKLIFNSNPVETVTIYPDRINVNGRNINSDSINDKDGDLDGDGIDDVWQKAVIITEGNVVINAGVKFKGTIIAKGNVVIESNETNPTVIRYDEELVQNITAKYNSVINLDEVFIGAPLNITGPIVITAEKSLVNTSTPNKDINYKETIYEADIYLKTGLWQITSK